jgi:hypothetical protein
MSEEGGLGYCVDCDEGAKLGGREALAACLVQNKNDKSKCTKEWDAFQAAVSGCWQLQCCEQGCVVLG